MLFIFRALIYRFKIEFKKLPDIIKKFFLKVIASVKSGERRYVTAALAIVTVIGILTALNISDAHIVYKINYCGRDIAMVRNKKSFDDARKTVINMVEGNNVEEVVADAEYKTAMALSPDIDNENELVNAIIDNTDGIVFGDSFIIDGTVKFRAEKKTLQKCVQNYFEQYRIEDESCTFEFVEKVEYESGYFLKEDVLGEAEINYALSGLSVRTKAEQVTERKVAYNIVEIKDDNMLIGSRKIILDGKEGLEKIVTTTEYINGVLTGEPRVEVIRINDPVDEAVNVGTAIPEAYEEDIDLPDSGYMFPLLGGGWEVSAYYGDGRGHKGIDLSAREGTPIRAVASGTVIRSEWYEGYGYCIDIDHGYGFVTRYAHASVLMADVGDVVQAGDTIALVGSTGDSTGSHLHIEFILGDRNVDPAFYLGVAEY